MFSSVSVADPGSKAATGPTQFYYLKLALKKMATEGIIVFWPLPSLPSPISIEICYCLAIVLGGKHAKPKQGIFNTSKKRTMFSRAFALADPDFGHRRGIR